ncbi:DUF6934 family protein [Myroides sp. LJL116]
MNLNTNVYNLEESDSEDDKYLRFLFISNGQEKIIKVIDFQYLQEFQDHDIYNLAFGNYDLDEDSIIDDANSNNGDPYQVFNTVLSSIPLFFKKFPNDKVIIQGSDSRDEFLEECKANCAKCKNGNCRKYNQRLRIYKSYVDKNYDDLIKEYIFFGGMKDDDGNSYLECYEKFKDYFCVVVQKK